MNAEIRSRKPLKPLVRPVAIAILALVLAVYLSAESTSGQQTNQPISSRLAFLRAQRASRQQQQQSQQNTTQTDKPKQSTPSSTAAPPETSSPLAPANLSPPANQPQPTNSNRTTRTAEIFQNGEGYNIFVTNTCDREVMHVNIRTSRPFFGVIHTSSQRQKASCSLEGNGETEFNLDINHVLNPQDPAYCGVVKARRESPEDKDLLSVVVVVRVHKNIELLDDKFFLLNCTNRCRKADCSPPSAKLTGLTSGPNDRLTDGGERETVTSPPDSSTRTQGEPDECTIWKFPWVITLLWCLGILLLAMIISHCIMCSSLVCRCVKTEVEEREPSVYEGATDDDDEDNLYNRKNHPMRIDYDNRDIYKTSNNYDPYDLDDVRTKSKHSSPSRNRQRR